jgi:hypothetical protein
MSVGGGFFGGGGKEIRTTNTTETNTINASFEGSNNMLQSLNANNAENSTFNFMDGGAIDRAFDFADRQSVGVMQALADIADFATSSFDTASGLAQPVNITKIIMYTTLAASVVLVAKYGFKK